MDIQIPDERLWATGSICDMPSFLKSYTLHDSHLLEIRTIPYDGILVLVHWDLYWNPTIPEQYDLLTIRFMTPYASRWTQGAWHQSTLNGARSSIVPEEARGQMLDHPLIDLRAFQGGHHEIQAYMLDDSLTHTVFEGMNWGELELLHSKAVSFSCFDEEGIPWPVPCSIESK